jgi:Sulfatase-modifying factor enzyme 1
MDKLDRIVGVREDGITMKHHWADCGFVVTPDHPVSWMSWQDGQAFCEWLTKKERDAGLILGDQAYRLPLDHEWSCAVSIGDKENASESPEEKSGKLKVFPWKAGWPPPKDFGNYDSSLKADSFEFSSPVGSFSANYFGIYDMDGNVGEWCEYVGKDGKLHPVGRGSDFAISMVGNEDQTLDHRFIISNIGVNNGGFIKIGIRGNNSGFRCVLATELKKQKNVSPVANNSSFGGGFVLPGDEVSNEKNQQKIPLIDFELQDFKAMLEQETRFERLEKMLKSAGEKDPRKERHRAMQHFTSLSTIPIGVNAVPNYLIEQKQ